MITIHHIDPSDKRQARQFIDLPFRLYRDCPQWVPPLLTDMVTAMNPAKHPFYEHSAAGFFIAMRGERVVGRIAALENVNYNRQHDARTGQFYFFDCEDDDEAAAALFGATFIGRF